MKTIIKFFIVMFLVSIYGCEDIIEEDITDDNITALYPKNNEEVISNVVNFQWNKLKGADNYRLQVYSSNQSMVLDSLVSRNDFTYALLPGSYQWRVRGENFAYQTAYTFPESFMVKQTSDLTNQQVQLLFPNPGVYTKNKALTFSWSAVNASKFYVFQLINVTNGNLLIHQKDNIDGTSYTLASDVITEDAQYTWRVKAVNNENQTETQYSSRNFYVDTTAPNQPQNTLPQQDKKIKVNESVTFEWSVPPDNGPITSAFVYTIQIATDESFSTVVHTNTVGNPSYEYTFTALDTYFWRVKAIDKAGNEGNYGTFYKITIEQ